MKSLDETAVVRFASARGGPATGPLTWGQRFMWDVAASLAPHDEHINQTLVVAVPAGLSVREVVGALAALAERHPSLRTRYAVGDDGEPYQIELASGELELRIAPARGDPERSSAALAALLAGRTFDLVTESPVRTGLCVDGDSPRAVVLAFSHIVTDARGGRILRDDLETLLAGGDPGPPPEYRPIDQAAFENSEQGRRIEAASLAHWRSRLPRFPPSMFAVQPGEPADPRYWRGELSSPALASGVAALMSRFRVTANSVVLAALALHLGHLLGIGRCALTVQVGNRLGRGRAAAVDTFLLEVPVVFEVDRDSYEATARAVQDEVFRSARHAGCSPARVRRLIDEVAAERGTPIVIDTMINTVGLPASEPAGASAAATTFAWREKRAVEGVKLLVISNLPADPQISALADTAYLPPTEIRTLLFGIERLVVQEAGRHP